MNKDMKKIAVSGTQSTGNIHLGNYLGSIANWLKMQDDYQCFFFLADLHAITINISSEQLHSSTLKTAAIYLASGLSPDKVTIFAQSSVKEHAELAWILNCVTPIGWLKRMTQFKDKAGKDQEKACLGLFSYPVLMAADILLYQADTVPVGEDQQQHLELTRDIAGVVNRKFNLNVFKLPEALIQGAITRVMSLKDGLKKMSKSDPSDLSRINLTDSADEIYKKIRKAKTDDIADISYDYQLRPEISNLIDIYSALTNISVENIINRYQSAGFAKFKEELAEVIISNLSPITSKYNELMRNQDYIDAVLKNGSEHASLKASKTIGRVKELFGFIN